MDEILREYARRFKRLVYVAPADRQVLALPAIGEGITVYGTPLYGKPLSERVRFLLARGRFRRWLTRVLEETGVELVQLRLPSIFTLWAFEVAASLRIPMTSYIAGDWDSSFAANYSFPLSGRVGVLLERLQHKVVRNTVPVTTGTVLAERYGHLRRCHPYFSTSHREVIRRSVAAVPSHLLFVGRLEPRKRVQDAIAALSLLRTDGRNVSLTVVGDGPERGALERLTERLGVAGHVTFTGYVWSPERLRELFLAADVLLFPSVSEGTPKAVAEAMAHGVVPVAVRTAGSNAAIIQPGVSGMLVDGARPDQLAQAIEELSSAPGSLARLAEGAYQYAAAHTVQVEMDRMWSFIFGNLQGSRKPVFPSV